jgi:membrane associated rhomboid family serine protease
LTRFTLENSPFTKAFVIFLAANSVLISMSDWKKAFTLKLNPHLTKYKQYWRIISHNLVFLSSSELLFGALLSYHLRIIERHWGTYKYVSFCLITTILGNLLEVLSMSLLGFEVVASGPYSFLFATLVQYYHDIPVSFRFKLLGMTGSDKWTIYFLSLQLMFSTYPTSLISSICGIIVGLLYRINGLKLRSFRVGSKLRKISSSLILPLLSTQETTINTTETFTRDQNEEFSQADLETLISMGFDRDRCIQALRMGRTLENATSILLS